LKKEKMNVFSVLLARYDSQALLAPAGGPPSHPSPQGERGRQAWQQLRQWCFSGAGSGERPRLKPGARPAVERHFSVAVLNARDEALAASLAEALCLELDGTRRMQACGSAAAQLRLRLSVKLREAAWWRPRRARDPWDSGHVHAHAAGQDRLARVFLPRRATLIVAAGLPHAEVLACITALHARQTEFDQPVRLLVLNPRADLPALLGELQGARSVPVIDIG
jgi:hypothetical protein